MSDDIIQTANEGAFKDPLDKVIPITEYKGMKGVDARSLQKAIGNNQDFSSWIKYQFNRAEAIEEEDFILLTKIGENSHGGSNRKDYHLSVSFAKELCMITGGQKGKACRKYFIKAEKAGRELMKALEECDPVLLRKIADLKEKNRELEKTKAWINDKKTATAMNTASQARKSERKALEALGMAGNYLQVKGIKWLSDFFNSKDAKTLNVIGRQLSRLSKENGYDPHKVDDIKYGSVNAYHKSIIEMFMQKLLDEPEYLISYRKELGK